MENSDTPANNTRSSEHSKKRGPEISPASLSIVDKKKQFSDPKNPPIASLPHRISKEERKKLAKAKKAAAKRLAENMADTSDIEID